VGRYISSGCNPADLGLESRAPAGVVLVASGRIHEGRLAGPLPEILEQLAGIASRIGAPLLIEADGARMLPLKAPADHEPAVPDFVNTIVVLAGLSGLGRPLSGEWVHRPERFSELSGLPLGAEITVEALERVLRHPEGGLKAAPPGSRRLVLFNQADTPVLQSAGNRLSLDLSGDYDGRIVAALGLDGAVYSVREPIAAVILAAGAATRMGAPKQLLDWKGKPLVVHAAEKALAAGCSPVVVVGGAAGDQVERAARTCRCASANPNGNRAEHRSSRRRSLGWQGSACSGWQLRNDAMPPLR
jgi:molybdenum cofactor cytidylyltransferase